VHFPLLTLWDSLESIKAFAGADVERARYYPEDEAYLLELEPTVTHYEVLVSPEDARPCSRVRHASLSNCPSFRLLNR